MSGIGGGGSAGFSADAALVMIDAVRNADLYEKRIKELQAQSEKAAAVIAQSTAVSTKAAKDQSFATLATTKLAAAQSSFEADKQASAALLADWEAKLTRRAADLDAREKDINDKVAAFKTDVDTTTQAIVAREAALTANEARIAPDREAVAAMKAEYEGKLDKLKGLLG